MSKDLRRAKLSRKRWPLLLLFTPLLVPIIIAFIGKKPKELPPQKITVSIVGTATSKPRPYFQLSNLLKQHPQTKILAVEWVIPNNSDPAGTVSGTVGYNRQKKAVLDETPGGPRVWTWEWDNVTEEAVHAAAAAETKRFYASPNSYSKVYAETRPEIVLKKHGAHVKYDPWKHR